ncbi:MAG: hypothetical protein V4556_00165 [Bacteroidota bacterium]
MHTNADDPNFKTYVSHEYDINFKELLRKAELLLDETNNPEFQKTILDYIEMLRFGIRDFCTHNNINIDQPSIVFNLTSYDHLWIYSYFLAQQLMLSPDHKCESILRYHFKKNTIQQLDFLNAVEHLVVGEIEKNKLFNNKSRLEKISNWVYQQKDIIEELDKPNVDTKMNQSDISNAENVSVANSEDITAPNTESSDLNDKALPEFKISRKASALRVITRIDERLKSLSHIEAKGDFLNVFIKQTEVDWKGTVQYLVYLLDQLKLKNRGYIQTKGRSGDEIWNAAIIYFKFGDTKIKNLTPLRLAQISNQVKKNIKKHVKMRAEIDFMLDAIDPDKLGLVKDFKAKSDIS